MYAERTFTFDIRNGDVTIGLDKDGNFLYMDVIHCGEWWDDIEDKDEAVYWLNYFGLTWEEALAKEVK